MKNWQLSNPKLVLVVGTTLLVCAVLTRSMVFVFAKFAALETTGEGPAAILLSPWYWMQLGTLGLQTVFWMFILRMIRLSTAYSAMSLVFVLNLAWAWLIFDEAINVVHIVGCAIIILGIIVTASPSAQETP